MTPEPLPVLCCQNSKLLCKMTPEPLPVLCCQNPGCRRKWRRCALTGSRGDVGRGWGARTPARCPALPESAHPAASTCQHPHCPAPPGAGLWTAGRGRDWSQPFSQNVYGLQAENQVIFCFLTKWLSIVNRSCFNALNSICGGWLAIKNQISIYLGEDSSHSVSEMSTNCR